ncbi:hypothetical protein M3Y97_00248600 [Aphelenchoides bicaudatus]|nr:hypothetical protein M3Y97_00248600 [Aphelenchoides bicaudatus]
MLLFWLALILFESLAVNAVSKEGYIGYGPIVGATPCCLDRLTSIVCRRLKEKSNASFLHNCMANPDFAFVQCCRTCFSIESDDPYQLDYQKTVQNLLLSPQNEHTCYNRRANEWCNDFVMRRSIFSEPAYSKFNCANVPVAFRQDLRVVK